MFAITDPTDWEGADVVDRHGDRVGKLHAVLVDRPSQQPTLAVVRSGTLTHSFHLVPLAGAAFGRDRLVVAHRAEAITAAPEVEDVTDPTPDDVAAVARHYGIEPPAHDAGYEPAQPPSVDEERITRAEALEREADDLRSAAGEQEISPAGRREADRLAERGVELLDEAAVLRSEADS